MSLQPPTGAGPAMPASQRRAAGGAAVAMIAGMAVLAILAPRLGAPTIFLCEAGLMLAVLSAIGLALNGRVLGAAIDGRNRVSLSKLQMLLWTTLVASALITLAAYRLHDPAIAALGAGLKITIPGELLLAMGVSAASFVATPTILSLKAAETPSAASVDDLATARGGTERSIGKVDARKSPADASFTDLFRGDEVGNALSVDLSKVQQVAITLLLLGVYAASVFQTLLTAPTANALPALDKDFVTLMAISHGSYLAYKAAPKTSSGVAGATDTPAPQDQRPPGAVPVARAHAAAISP